MDKIKYIINSAKIDENKLQSPFTESWSKITSAEVEKCTAIGKHLSGIGQELNDRYVDKEKNDKGRINLENRDYINLFQVVSEMVKKTTVKLYLMQMTYIVCPAFESCCFGENILNYIEQYRRKVCFIW